MPTPSPTHPAPAGHKYPSDLHRVALLQGLVVLLRDLPVIRVDPAGRPRVRRGARRGGGGREEVVGHEVLGFLPVRVAVPFPLELQLLDRRLPLGAAGTPGLKIRNPVAVLI